MLQHTSTPNMLAFPELSSATNPRPLGLHKAGCLRYCNILGIVNPHTAFHCAGSSEQAVYARLSRIVFICFCLAAKTTNLAVLEFAVLPTDKALKGAMLDDAIPCSFTWKICRAAGSDTGIAVLQACLVAQTASPGTASYVRGGARLLVRDR